jgi:hypothetical protein
MFYRCGPQNFDFKALEAPDHHTIADEPPKSLLDPIPCVSGPIAGFAPRRGISTRAIKLSRSIVLINSSSLLNIFLQLIVEI